MAAPTADWPRAASAAAENLPFAWYTFSWLAMSVVFFFLADRVWVLRECRPVLRPGASLAIYTTGAEQARASRQEQGGRVMARREAAKVAGVRPLRGDSFAGSSGRGPGPRYHPGATAARHRAPQQR
jgi:hypothetical protein